MEINGPPWEMIYFHGGFSSWAIISSGDIWNLQKWTFFIYIYLPTPKL